MKFHEIIAFRQAFWMLVTSDKPFLVWQKAPNPPAEPGDFSEPWLCGVFDIEKNLFSSTSPVVEFTTDEWFVPTPQPTPQHRLALWWKYWDFSKSGQQVYSAMQVAYVVHPNEQETREYLAWKKGGSRVYQDGPAPHRPDLSEGPYLWASARESAIR